jgi:UDP-N-acetylmuramate: L-alanyl-gamma-D-glutamyl-meso-diaminopimelate ligase
LALVFYDPEALRIKNREVLPPEAIIEAFNHPNLKVFTQPQALHQFLFEQQYHQTFLLMMSSGNYGKLNWETLQAKVASASSDGSHTMTQ